MSAPSGKMVSSTLSIKKMREKKEAKLAQAIDLDNMPVNDYTLDDFKMAWRQFAYEMKKEGKDTFYNALIKREPKRLGDDNYLLEVDNQVQIDYIRPILPDLLGHIRGKLNNYSIEVQLEITENPNDQPKFLTGKDKFAAMARKNPNMHAFKKMFNLEIDY